MRLALSGVKGSNAFKFNWGFTEYSNSRYLEFHKSKVHRIENTFQNKEIIPKLSNNLDKILNLKGIVPVESINRLNEGRIGDFYMRLPQYSEIDES